MKARERQGEERGGREGGRKIPNHSTSQGMSRSRKPEATSRTRASG